jgi:hypothetical protein
MAFLIMYFAGKEEQFPAICDFVHRGYYVPGIFYLYQVLPNAEFCFMWLLNLRTHAKE